MKMLLYVIIGLLTSSYTITLITGSVSAPANGLVSMPSPKNPLDIQVINTPSLPSLLPVPSSLPSSSPIVSQASFRSPKPSFPNVHPQMLPVVSPNQPHLSNGLASKLKSKLPFWSKMSPAADKRALNLVRLTNQYRRGIPNAMALYQAILEQHERRWMLDSPEFRHQFPPGHPEMMMRASNRKVGKVVNRIMSSFIGDCVGVIISEIFRKMGEVAGEVARLVISNAARHILGREELSIKPSLPSILPSPGKTVSRIIQAIKPKVTEIKKTV